jgi:hypothetical protein
MKAAVELLPMLTVRPSKTASPATLAAASAAAAAAAAVCLTPHLRAG